jgi:hypothetical protein
MNLKGSVLLLLAPVALSACATIPTGPSVMVWPAPGKPLEAGPLWEPQRDLARPMERDGKSRGDMTMPTCNACTQKGIKSQVPCGLIDEPSRRHLHHWIPLLHPPLDSH